MANKVKCNACTNSFTYSEWNNYNGGMVSGIIDIDSDIANEVVTQKYYYCPNCNKKLRHSSVTDDSNADGSFDIVDETSGKIIDVSGGSSGGGGSVSDPNAETRKEKYYSRYNYEKINFVSEDETEDQKELMSWTYKGKTMYGTKAMNTTQDGIYEAYRLHKLKELQTENLAQATKKLRMNKPTKVAIFGDSVMWGFWTLTDGFQLGKDYVTPGNTDDYGSSDSGYASYGIYQNAVRIPDKFIEALNKVYEGNITYVNKVWTGTTAGIKKVLKGGKEELEGNSIFAHYKASCADFSIINLGINDAMGGHVSAEYVGKPELFIEGYRALIERELENGTAVICLSPCRQATVSTDRDGFVDRKDVDDRTIVDIYEQIIYNLCQDYGIPFINGNIMTKNIPNVESTDFTHFTAAGNTSIGYRLASILIGQGPQYPYHVNDGSYFAVRHQLDNVNITGNAKFAYSTTSPNIPTALTTADLQSTTVVRNPGGIEAVLDDNTSSVVWSFYCDADGMVVIPCLQLEDTTEIKMELDFGADQGKWGNYWTYANSDASIDRAYKEPSSITINNAATTGNKYGRHLLTGTHSANKVIRITTEGWHTIRIYKTSEAGKAHIFGLDFMTFNTYSNFLMLKSLES